MNTSVQHYVAGFAFSGTHVLLIRKTKPAWQNGKLNGIGGKIEAFDHDPVAAIVREFYEETGIKSNGMNWRKFDVEAFEHGVIHWFYSEALPITTFRKTTEEPPEIWPVRTIIEQGIGGIKGPSLPLYNVPYLLHKADTFRRNPDQQIPFFSV